MSSLHCSLLRPNLGFLLKHKFSAEFTILPRLDLSISNKTLTPDICIYPKMNRELGKQADIVKMKEMPITTVEILSFTQSLSSIIQKIKEFYFPSGVKSAWVIIPELLAIVLYSPDKEDYEWFKSGKMTDPATGITVDVKEVFDVD